MTIQDVFQHYAGDLRQVEAFMEREFRSEVALIPEISRTCSAAAGKVSALLLILRHPERYGASGVPHCRGPGFIHTAPFSTTTSSTRDCSDGQGLGQYRWAMRRASSSGFPLSTSFHPSDGREHRSAA
jgi:hypothetical protein